jgi:predicted MPP superfamily phosphohydrolase
VLSDLQTDVIGDYERSVFRRTMEERPDLILLPGDYLQERDGARRAGLRAELQSIFREVGLAAPLGIYAVKGNVDAGDWPILFEGFPVTALAETRTVMEKDLCLTGLSLRDSFDPSLAIPRRERFHIAVGHAPDFALGDVQADLLVAGHTHGGQVRLPGIGPLVTLSRVPRAWAAGVTRLDDRRTLVVSRGVGMERGDAPRLRFLCRPELVVIECFPASSR